MVFFPPSHWLKLCVKSLLFHSVLGECADGRQYTDIHNLTAFLIGETFLAQLVNKTCLYNIECG